MRLIPRAVTVALTLTMLAATSPAVVRAAAAGFLPRDQAAVRAAAAPTAPTASGLSGGRHDPQAPAHALATSLPVPPGAGGAAGSVRIEADPARGRLCVTATGVQPAAGGVVSALALSADVTGARTTLLAGPGAIDATDGAPHCTSYPILSVGDLLAHPDTYSVVVLGVLADGTADDVTRGKLAAAAPELRPFAVGTRVETITDSTRRTPRRGRVPGRAGRRLTISYYYPAVAPDSLEASPEGPFPVVLFAPGYDATPLDYDLTLRAWAQAGYVVAAVLFPGSGRGLPGPATESDLAQQPQDLRVVLDAISKHTHSPSSFLDGLADVTRVAVAGHSDGGSTAAAAGLLAGYTDPRYDAVLVLAGARFSGRLAGRKLPLLVISGARDEFNSQRVFADVLAAGRASKAWVQAVGARHEPPFIEESRQADVLRALEVDFLDRWLLGLDTRASERVHAATPGVTRLVGGGF